MLEVFSKEEIEIIKNEKDLLKKSTIIVEKLFEEKKDKEGKPYINHLLFVMNHVDTFEEKVVGIMHDTIEDTVLNFDDLKYLEYPDNIIYDIKLLTRDKSISYKDYINNLLNSNNLVSIRVKKADMTHNIDKNRLNNLDENLKNKLINKYTEPYKKINEYLEKRK